MNRRSMVPAATEAEGEKYKISGTGSGIGCYGATTAQVYSSSSFNTSKTCG